MTSEKHDQSDQQIPLVEKEPSISLWQRFKNVFSNYDQTSKQLLDAKQQAKSSAKGFTAEENQENYNKITKLTKRPRIFQTTRNLLSTIASAITGTLVTIGYLAATNTPIISSIFGGLACGITALRACNTGYKRNEDGTVERTKLESNEPRFTRKWWGDKWNKAKVFLKGAALGVAANIFTPPIASYFTTAAAISIITTYAKAEDFKPKEQYKGWWDNKYIDKFKYASKEFIKNLGWSCVPFYGLQRISKKIEDRRLELAKDFWENKATQQPQSLSRVDASPSKSENSVAPSGTPPITPTSKRESVGFIKS